jgi:hypothetical protein
MKFYNINDKENKIMKLPQSGGIKPSYIQSLKTQNFPRVLKTNRQWCVPSQS